jgi:hypothetical protein
VQTPESYCSLVYIILTWPHQILTQQPKHFEGLFEELGILNQYHDQHTTNFTAKTFRSWKLLFIGVYHSTRDLPILAQNLGGIQSLVRIFRGWVGGETITSINVTLQKLEVNQASQITPVEQVR